MAGLPNTPQLPQTTPLSPLAHILVLLQAADKVGSHGAHAARVVACKVVQATQRRLGPHFLQSRRDAEGARGSTRDQLT